MVDETSTTGTIEAEPQNQTTNDTPPASGGDDSAKLLADANKRIHELSQENAKRRVENVGLKKTASDLESKVVIKDDPDAAMKLLADQNQNLANRLNGMVVLNRVNTVEGLHPGAALAVTGIVQRDLTVDPATGQIEGFDEYVKNLKATDPYYFQTPPTNGEQQKKVVLGAPTSTGQSASAVDAVMVEHANSRGFTSPEAVEKFRTKVWPNLSVALGLKTKDTKT